MWKRYPAKKYRGIGLIILFTTWAAAAALVAINHWTGWIATKTAYLAFLGLLLTSVGSLGLLIGAIYREVFYVRTNYADFYTAPYQYCWGMATHVFITAIGICSLVTAMTGVDALGWMRIFSR